MELFPKVYKIASKSSKKPILSDSKQTVDMVNIWIAFIENKSKYGIKFCEFIDTETNKIMTRDDLEKSRSWVFNKFQQDQRYRILMDFQNYKKH